MLESIREGVKKPWVKIVVFAIVISFVFAGYFTSSFFLGDPNAVAIVNGESISRADFQQEYQRTKAQRADYYNANVKTEEDERAFQESVLQTLINQKVTEQATAELGFRLSSDELRKVIQSFDGFKDAQGQYSPEVVNQTLARLGKSKEWLKTSFNYQETYRQMVDGVTSTAFTLDSEVEADYKLLAQKRSGKLLKLDIEKFKKADAITEEQIEQYYQENLEAFRVEEKISVDFIELSIEKLQAMQEVTEEEVENYYQENLNKFQSAEQKRLSYVQVSVEDDAAAAEAKINELSKRIANGEDFDKVGEDADEAGDLGVLLPGVLEEAADEAVKSLTAAGQTTEVIEIEDGFQILKLTELIPGQTQSLEEVRESLVAELKQFKAEEAYFAKAELLKEKAFEFSDSLVESSQAIGIEIQTSELFGLSSRDGIFANQQVKEAAFSSDVKENLINSDPIEIAENHIVVLRVKNHQPSEVQPLETVKERVKTSVVQSEAKKAASELANNLLAKLKAKEEVAAELETHQLAWTDLDKVERNNASLSFLSSQQFFKMPVPAEGEVNYDLVEDFQGYAILMLNNVEQGDWESAEEAAKKQRMLFVERYFANASFAAFIEDNRLKADVQRNLDVVADLL